MVITLGFRPHTLGELQLIEEDPRDDLTENANDCVEIGRRKKHLE